jgi:predicted nucleic acid-binding protein
VAAEALLPSRYTGVARSYLARVSTEAVLVVPEGVFEVEVLSAARKALLRGAIASVSPIVDALATLPAARVSLDKMLLHLAVDVLTATSASIHDSIYIALAYMLNARLATLDAGMASAASRILGAERVEYIARGYRGEGEGGGNGPASATDPSSPGPG